MPKLHRLMLDVAVIQLTEPTSIHERPDYIARTEVGGVHVTGNRADSALGAAQSLFYILTGAAQTEKAQEATIGLSLALAGTDLDTVGDEVAALERQGAGSDRFRLPQLVDERPGGAPAGAAAEGDDGADGDAGQ